MNKAQYKELKRRAEEAYQIAMKTAAEKRIKELAAIDTVWQMTNPSAATKNSSDDATGTSSRGSLSKAIDTALGYVPDVFNKGDIRTALEQISPEIAENAKEASITGRLIRLAENGKIEKVKSGAGGTPSEYRIIKPPSEEDGGNENNDETSSFTE